MPTYTQYRRALGKKLNSYLQITTGSQATTPGGAYTGKATGTNAQRTIVSSDLADMDLTGTLSGLPNTRYENSFVYLPATLEQRRIASRGFVGTAVASAVSDSVNTVKVGYLVCSRDFNVTVVASSVAEIWTKLPPHQDAERMPSARTLINRALSAMHMPKSITVAGVTAQTRYDITSSVGAWLTRPEQLLAVYQPDTVSGQPDYPLPGGGSIELDGEKVYLDLHTTVPTGQNFVIKVSRPRDTWIKVTGTWADSTVGLVNEADEATGELLPTILVATYLYWDALYEQAAPTERESIGKERVRAAALAFRYMRYNQPSLVLSRGLENARTASGGYRGPGLVGGGGRWR